MNLEDLRAAQTRERATDGLQDLRDSFYGDVAAYIADLKERRDAAASAAQDPFGDPEVQELTDEIETAEQVTEAIYERRMGKLVKQASLAAAGMSDDVDGLTDEERDLYGDLVERIEANKSHVLEVISGEADPTDGEPNRSDDAEPESSSATGSTSVASSAEADSAAAAMGGGLDDAETVAEPDADDAETVAASDADDTGSDSESDERDERAAIAADLERERGDDQPSVGDDTGQSDAEADASQSDAESSTGRPDAEADTDGGTDAVVRTTVRVTDDVGEIFGVDERPYTLEAEDVVTLPEENAAPLVEKGAAEKLD